MLCRVDWINRMWQQWSDLWGLWLFHHGGFHGLLVLGPEAWVRVPGVLQVLGPAAEGHRAEDLAHGDEAAGAGRLLQTGPGCPDSCDTQGCAAPGWWRWWWWWRPILHPAQVTTTTLSYFYPAHSAPPTPTAHMHLLTGSVASSLILLFVANSETVCHDRDDLPSTRAVGGGRHQLTYGGPILLTAPRPAAAAQRSTQDRVNTDNFQHFGCSSVAKHCPHTHISSGYNS